MRRYVQVAVNCWKLEWLRGEVVDDVEVFRPRIESFQNGPGALRNVGSLIVVAHEVLDTVKTLEPHDSGELDFIVFDFVRSHQMCANQAGN